MENNREDEMIRILPENDKLPINLLSRILKDKSESYKLFWFKAIVDSVCEGKTIIAYDDLINRMIAEGWYMVREFRLNLGPSDAIEMIIKEIEKYTQLKPSEKKENIIKYLNENTNAEIKKAQTRLKKNVPYRLQAPFMGHLTEAQWRNYDVVSEMANTNSRIIYYYEKSNSNKKQIRINEIWIEYIIRNQVILKGWIQNELIKYLQRRNPNVPGIPLKLEPKDKRQLDKSKKFWKAAIEIWDVKDIYTDEIFSAKTFAEYGNIDIDHFIPWSYVASDEIWNLTPTFASINRSKSNYLPSRNNDYEKLAYQQYKAFVLSNENKEMKKLFKEYKHNNLNNEDLNVKLYRENIREKEFCDTIVNIVKPVYLSASNMGFADWDNRMYEKD